MDHRDAWHSNDAFWELMEPMIFSPQRQARAAEEAAKIIELLEIEPGARILDLPCGNGRHSLALAGRGFAVTGVDRTAAFIEEAKAAAAERELAATFVVGDMREYRAPDHFDIVMNLFGSFGYFEDPEDDRRVIENLVASLRPGGRMLIETMGKEIMARDFTKREWSEEGDLLLLAERSISQDWSRIETRWIAIRGAERIEHRVSVRSYSAVELSALLHACGVRDVRVYGSLDATAYDQTAQRLVIVGRK